VSIYYKIYYKFVKQYATKSHDKERHSQRAESEKTLEALGKSWFFREDRSNEKDTVRLPWQQSMDLKNPLEPQGLFAFCVPVLHHNYTNSTPHNVQSFLEP
jgi:hypothetical protein